MWELCNEVAVASLFARGARLPRDSKAPGSLSADTEDGSFPRWEVPYEQLRPEQPVRGAMPQIVWRRLAAPVAKATEGAAGQRARSEARLFNQLRDLAFKLRRCAALSDDIPEERKQRCLSEREVRWENIRRRGRSLYPEWGEWTGVPPDDDREVEVARFDLVA